MSPAAGVWVSCGETSGDQRGAELLAARPRQAKPLNYFGIAGPRLRAAGVEPTLAMEDLQTFGVLEALRQAPKNLRALRQATELCRQRRPKLAILVDYGEFHMRLGAKLRQQGTKVFHLAPPKLWAWGAWRSERLRQSADAVGVLFPFEADFYREHGIAAVCVGHPAAAPATKPAATKNKLLLLPGSRPDEILRHHNLVVEGTRALAAETGLQRVYCLAAGQALPAGKLLPPDILLRHCQSPADYADGALAVAASGTVTIELAALGIPHVVCFVTSPLTFALAFRLVNVRWANPVNIAAGKFVVEELVQDAATTTNIEGALRRTWQRRDTVAAELSSLAQTLHKPKGFAEAWQLCDKLLA